MINRMTSLSDDPVNFVKHAFPWGHGVLKDRQPMDWQLDCLNFLTLKNPPPSAAETMLKQAIAHGNGAGATALLCWTALWALSTRVDTRGIITAATEQVLWTKTWPELRKWYDLCVAKEWFIFADNALFPSGTAFASFWRIDAVPANPRTPEAFAGICNAGHRTIYLMDEAAAIPDIIWHAIDGSATPAKGEEVIWVAASTSSRTKGQFHDCFRSDSGWVRTHVTTEGLPIVRQEQIELWRQEYGANSDWFRVHVKGGFPLTP